MNIFAEILIMLFVPQINGDNIMLGKPSEQSSTDNHPSTNANDGNPTTASLTGTQGNPYWQGDLQGYYKILNITVQSFYDIPYDAYIGASLLDLSDPDSDVHKCGQWPKHYSVSVVNILCCFQQPVRFIRIWYEGSDYISLNEVIVEAPSEQTHRAYKYGTVMMKKLAAPKTSLTVAMPTECGILCHKDQTCHAFSFRKGGQLNCLLGIPGTLVSDTDWRTFIIQDCYNPTTRPGNIDP